MSDVRIMLRPDVSTARVVLAWVLVAIWAAIVWWLGSEQWSAGTTSRFLGPLIDWLWPTATPAERWTLLMGIRKLAHPSVYAVLAVLACRAALMSGVSGLTRGAAAALALAVSLAGLDELRQTQTRTRTGQASDVLLDATGASAALAALGYLRRRGSGSVRAGVAIPRGAR
jgi:VanZ family protein